MRSISCHILYWIVTIQKNALVINDIVDDRQMSNHAFLTLSIDLLKPDYPRVTKSCRNIKKIVMDAFRLHLSEFNVVHHLSPNVDDVVAQSIDTLIALLDNLAPEK